MTLAFRTILVTLLAFAAGIAVMSFGASAQGEPKPYRLFVPMVASDGVTFPGNGGLPAPDPSYCPGSTGSGAPPTPPNSVFGFITINGQTAPAGTIVQIVFDGKVGPATRSVVENGQSGYKITYAGGLTGCANQVGADIAIRVNGQVFNSNVSVGDEAANPFLRFDVVVP